MSTIEDELTGLHNRRSFLSLLRRQIAMANDRQHSLALVVVDIDGFARINGAHGYAFGDALLRHVAAQLGGAARRQDYAARIGSDRFALVLPRVLNAGHAELAVQKLYRLLEVPFRQGDQTQRVAVTAGVALCPAHATHPEFLLRKAEKAVESARVLGRRSAFAADERGLGLAEDWDIEIELDGAIERGELLLLYQPQVRAGDLRPVGAEALMRWQHPTRGMIPPDLFIPVAERTGQIKPLTVWAVNTALRQAAHWRHPWGELAIGVNVPADLVAQHDLPDLVDSAMKLWRAPGVQLVLEITERSLMDARHSFEILAGIRELGARVSIDDFGTGYSCLAYFKDLPADELKVDRSFVTALLSDPASAHLSNLIIDLAHRFGLSVVAEGVEDEATLDVLRASGCDVIQGYLVGRAMGAGAMERWLNEPRPCAADAS